MLSVLLRGGTSGSSATPECELSGVNISVLLSESWLISYGEKSKQCKELTRSSYCSYGRLKKNVKHDL